MVSYKADNATLRLKNEHLQQTVEMLQGLLSKVLTPVAGAGPIMSQEYVGPEGVARLFSDLDQADTVEQSAFNKASEERNAQRKFWSEGEGFSITIPEEERQ